MIWKRKPFTRIPGQGEWIFIQLFNLQFSYTYLLWENNSKKTPEVPFENNIQPTFYTLKLFHKSMWIETNTILSSTIFLLLESVLKYLLCNLIFNDIRITKMFEVLWYFILTSVQIQRPFGSSTFIVFKNNLKYIMCHSFIIFIKYIL